MIGDQLRTRAHGLLARPLFRALPMGRASPPAPMNLPPPAAPAATPASNVVPTGADETAAIPGRPTDPDAPRDEASRPPKRSRLRSVLPAPIWHVGRLLVLALIVEYLVVPQLA